MQDIISSHKIPIMEKRMKGCFDSNAYHYLICLFKYFIHFVKSNNAFYYNYSWNTPFSHLMKKIFKIYLIRKSRFRNKNQLTMTRQSASALIFTKNVLMKFPCNDDISKLALNNDIDKIIPRCTS